MMLKDHVPMYKVELDESNTFEYNRLWQKKNMELHQLKYLILIR